MSIGEGGYKLNIHIHFTTSAAVFEGYSPLGGLGTARYLIHVQPVYCELSLICISASASSAASVSGSRRDLVPYNRNTGLHHSGLSRLWVGTNISILILAVCACQAGLIIVLSFSFPSCNFSWSLPLGWRVFLLWFRHT